YTTLFRSLTQNIAGPVIAGVKGVIMPARFVEQIVLAIAGRRNGLPRCVQNEAIFNGFDDQKIFRFADGDGPPVMGISLWIVQVINMQQHIIAAEYGACCILEAQILPIFCVAIDPFMAPTDQNMTSIAYGALHMFGTDQFPPIMHVAMYRHDDSGVQAIGLNK